MAFLCAGLLSYCGWWGGSILVGSQIGSGQMHWQRVAGRLLY